MVEQHRSLLFQFDKLTMCKVLRNWK